MLCKPHLGCLGCPQARSKVSMWNRDWCGNASSNRAQTTPRRLFAYVACCLSTRRSTSRGLSFRGKRLLKRWGITQSTITPSFAESDLHGICRGASASLGCIRKVDFTRAGKTHVARRNLNQMPSIQNRCKLCNRINTQKQTINREPRTRPAHT